MAEADPLEWLGEASSDMLESWIADMEPEERREWPWFWPNWARPSQLAPSGDWRIWLVMAGRGFGKTRCGAEWVNTIAEADCAARIALVAANLGEARAVMVEGESGLLSVGAPWRRPTFEPSLRRLIWPNGAQAHLYSAAEPEALRGPQHSHACRAGAEGGLRQRGAPARRRPAALHRRRRSCICALHTRRRPDMARCRGCDRRVDRAHRLSGDISGRWLDLHAAPRRDANL
jgi:hypothetical protein